MRKWFFLSILVLQAGCNAPDYNALNKRLDVVETEFARQEALVDRLNRDIEAAEQVFDALTKGKLVVSCEALPDGSGYTIAFSDGMSITLHNGVDGRNGTDGTDASDGVPGISPIIGVAAVNGINYWTLDGDFLTDATGERIPLTLSTTEGRPGIVPRLRIRDGYWQVSYDRGSSWSNLGPVTSGTASPYIFSVVSEESDVLKLTLTASGQVLTLAKLLPPDLRLSGWQGVAIAPSHSVDIPYQVLHATADTRLYAVANSGFSAAVIASSVLQGVIRVTAPAVLSDAQVLVTADSGFGRICMRVLSFEKGILTVSGLEEPSTITDFDW